MQGLAKISFCKIFVKTNRMYLNDDKSKKRGICPLNKLKNLT